MNRVKLTSGRGTNARHLASVCLLFLAAIACQAQVHESVCQEGEGRYSTKFRTGVSVAIEPFKKDGFSTRLCGAALEWDKQEFKVAEGAYIADLDAFGIDLDAGAPVAAFQIKNSDDACCVTYKIVTLRKPPQLVRTLTGGNFFSASDRDLDGRIEIWTEDTAAFAGFDGLTLSEFGSAPAVVVRFAKGQLLEVGTEFQSNFDRAIAALRGQIDPKEAHEFKDSDGKLSPAAHIPADRMHRLRAVKAKSLEIVWDFLYSGREQEAWHALADIWPAADVDRIQKALRDAHDHGIVSQCDGVSSGPRRKKRVDIWGATLESMGGPDRIVPPSAILLRRPPPAEALPEGELTLDLFIDSAGKVVRALPSGTTKWNDDGLIEATKGWKFVPAFRGERAVASFIHMAVSLRQ